jgi:hypothetical protein
MANNIFNSIFHLLHITIIIFNLFGWMWRKTRRANLILLFLTAFSWLGLGYWYGWGYCPITEWHWRIKMELGHQNIPDSYIKLLLDKLSGKDLNPRSVDFFTVIAFGAAFLASIFTNLRDFLKR